MCVVHDTLSWNAIATVDVEEQICNAKSACGKVARFRYMVPGGSREPLPNPVTEGLPTTRELATVPKSANDHWDFSEMDSTSRSKEHGLLFSLAQQLVSGTARENL
jgi:hypothetical protein